MSRHSDELADLVGRSGVSPETLEAIGDWLRRVTLRRRARPLAISGLGAHSLARVLAGYLDRAGLRVAPIGERAVQFLRTVRVPSEAAAVRVELSDDQLSDRLFLRTLDCLDEIGGLRPLIASRELGLELPRAVAVCLDLRGADVLQLDRLAAER